MIRQIRRLTRPVPAFGPGVSGIAIYSEVTPDGTHLRVASETGFEGVACVDDAARLASLYIAIWRRHNVAWARGGALEMLGFVRAMQTPEGWFVNFLGDWDGTKNLVGRTSIEPAGPWLARACHALAAGAAAFGDSDCATALERALPWLAAPTPHLDLRAVALLGALDYHNAGGGSQIREHAISWAEELYGSRRDGILPDHQDVAEVHLWGHLQECALAAAGDRFGRPDWVRAAQESADRLLVPPALQRFPGVTRNPFDVSCTIRGLETVGRATGEAQYLDAAGLARAWFDGRNHAAAPVFDRKYGRIYDGIDEGRVSANSGAEANIEGGLALLGANPFPPSAT